MLSRLFTPILLLLLSSRLLAATMDFSGEWTDGSMSFSGSKLNDSIWVFDGADLHEGGYRFALRRLTDSSFFLMGAFTAGVEDKDVTPAIGKRGDRVTYRNLDGARMLIVRSPSGAIGDLLKRMEPGQSLEDLVTKTKTAFELSGKYVDELTGKELLFYSNRTDADGLSSSSGPYAGVYYFETSYDFPANVITFRDGKSYYYVVTEDGLDLFVAKEGKDEDWSKGKKLMSLKKIYWFNLSGNAKLNGKYAFASTIVLTRDILYDFTVSQLRIMRNEIYARHGYIPKSKEVRSYFEAQDWYRPVDGAGEDQLSELEKLNVQLIVDHVREVTDQKNRLSGGFILERQ